MMLLVLPLLALHPCPSSDDPVHTWPHMRGPSQDGRAAGGSLFESESLGLRLAWKAPLGPSYSGIAVASGRVVTTFSDGTKDRVVALDASTGERLWTFELGPTYLGHDGSEDGPISSPALAEGAVFVADARGQLVAVDLETGARRWSHDLPAELGVEVDEYGFVSSPLVEGDLVILQAGAPGGGAVLAFDARTGELRWRALEGRLLYQSPVVMELAGRRQLVVLNTEALVGLDPGTGAVLWSHELGEGSSASMGVPTPLGDDRFAASVSGQLAAFEVARTEDGFAVTELYRSRELGRTYAAPVHHEGRLYGFKSDFLTCVDAATGRRLWKSRPPGGKGLLGVEDRLLVFGAEGFVTLARASAEGYEEEARVQALEHSGLVWPSFASGHLFVRNSGELSCIAVVDQRAPALAAGAVEPLDSAFARLVAEIEGGQDPEARIDAYLAEQESLPILEGSLVHFVYRGDVQDVAILGAMTGGANPEPLRRIAGTDVHWRSFEIEPGARWEYAFQVDFEEVVPDPANPRRCPGRRGELSEVVTPGYPVEAHFEPPAGGPRGSVEAFEYTSERLGNSRGLSVYLPPGYADSSAVYPLLLVHDGGDWLERGGLANTLDATVGDTVRPLVVAFVDPIDDWWFEAGGTRTEEYLDMLADELVPYLAARYRLSDRAADRALVGVRGFGLTAAFGVLRRPDVFGSAAMQSASLADVARHAFFARLAEAPEIAGSFYVDWGRYDARNLDNGVDLRADGRRLHAALVEAGYEVAGGEALDGTGWGSWRSRSDDWLAALFPLE